ncbi:MAG: hypothetical protein II432_01730 [Erysipelotrichaceae bacterium]|nr:hypothetical protein [Erysipelotrichaceae bacterium]
MSKKNKNQVEATENKIVENNENQEAVPEQKEEVKKTDKKRLAGIITGVTGVIALGAYGVTKVIKKIHSTDDDLMEGIADPGDDDDDLETEDDAE